MTQWSAPFEVDSFRLLFCTLAGAAGLRWTSEECFQRAEEDLGHDHCNARL